MFKKTGVLIVVALALSVSACGVLAAPPDDGPIAPTPQETLVPIDDVADAPDPTTVPVLEQPTSGTDASEPSEAAPCTYDSDFVTDVTIPDGMEVQAGTPFTKTWRLQNSGTCAWDSGVELVQIEGDTLQTVPGAVPVRLPQTPPGQELDVSVTLWMPPETPTGSQQLARFQLRGPDGQRFGTRPFVLVTAVSLGNHPPLILDAATLAEALVDRDFALLEPLMGNPFVIGYWQSEGVEYTPQDAIRYLLPNLLPPDAEITYTLDRDEFPSLDGIPLETIFGPDVSPIDYVYSQGWGEDGNGEAILIIAEYAGGDAYWYGMLYGRFD